MLLLTYLIYRSVSDIRDEQLGPEEIPPQEIQFWFSAFFMIFLWPLVLASQARHIPEDRNKLKTNWVLSWICVGLISLAVLGPGYLAVGFVLGVTKGFMYMYYSSKIYRKSSRI